MTIERRPLGRTGADVTILGYGAMELRGRPHGPAIADEDAGRLLNAVLDGGINLIDTTISVLDGHPGAPGPQERRQFGAIGHSHSNQLATGPNRQGGIASPRIRRSLPGSVAPAIT